MGEQTDQLTGDGGTDFGSTSADDFLSGDEEAADEEAGFEDYFSPRVFLLSVVALAGGLLFGGVFVPIFGRTIGLVATAFGAGLLSGQRRYAELGLAGGLVGGLAMVLDYAWLTMVGVGLPLVAVGAGGGLGLALLGAYLGRDLRAGLTRDL